MPPPPPFQHRHLATLFSPLSNIIAVATIPPSAGTDGDSLSAARRRNLCWTRLHNLLAGADAPGRAPACCAAGDVSRHNNIASSSRMVLLYPLSLFHFARIPTLFRNHRFERYVRILLYLASYQHQPSRRCDFGFIRLAHVMLRAKPLMNACCRNHRAAKHYRTVSRLHQHRGWWRLRAAPGNSGTSAVNIDLVPWQPARFRTARLKPATLVYYIRLEPH